MVDFFSPSTTIVGTCFRGLVARSGRTESPHFTRNVCEDLRCGLLRCCAADQTRLVSAPFFPLCAACDVRRSADWFVPVRHSCTISTAAQLCSLAQLHRWRCAWSNWCKDLHRGHSNRTATVWLLRNQVSCLSLQDCSSKLAFDL